MLVQCVAGLEHLTWGTGPQTDQVVKETQSHEGFLDFPR